MGKKMFTIFVQKFGLSKPVLYLSFQGYYYFAMVEDLILRLTWSLSVSIGEGLLLHSEVLKTLLAALEIFR